MKTDTPVTEIAKEIHVEHCLKYAIEPDWESLSEDSKARYARKAKRATKENLDRAIMKLTKEMMAHETTKTQLTACRSALLRIVEIGQAWEPGARPTAMVHEAEAALAQSAKEGK